MKDYSPTLAFRYIFLGFLLASLLGICLHRLPSQDTVVGIQYVNHGVDPDVMIGIKEADNHYTYVVTLKLINDGDSYDATCRVEREHFTPVDWELWRTHDTDPSRYRNSKPRRKTLLELK